MKFKLKESLNSIFYWFDDDGWGSADFEFEPTLDNEYNFREELLKTYSKETLEEILSQFLHEDYPDYDSFDIETQTELLKDELLDHLDEFSEDAKNFFEDAAYELYIQGEEYEKEFYPQYRLTNYHGFI